jgi:hypothetical protein
MALLSPKPGWQVPPPAGLPLNPTMPRPTPSRRDAVIGYLVRQASTRGPLARWLVERENRYYAGPGRKWDCALIAYAGARDAACWQLKKSEAVLWAFLEASAEVHDRRKPA